MWRFLRNRRLLLCLHTIFRALIYWAHRAVVLAIAWHLVNDVLLIWDIVFHTHTLLCSLSVCFHDVKMRVCVCCRASVLVALYWVFCMRKHLALLGELSGLCFWLNELSLIVLVKFTQYMLMHLIAAMLCLSELTHSHWCVQPVSFTLMCLCISGIQKAKNYVCFWRSRWAGISLAVNLRVCTDPGKSWNLTFKFSRPRKSWNQA